MYFDTSVFRFIEVCVFVMNVVISNIDMEEDC